MYNYHGGNLDAVERKYGIPKHSIIDFSGNINPLGVPESVQKALTENILLLSTYPDASYLNLRKAVSGYTGVDASQIMVGNGSTELISLFIETLKPQKAVIIVPAYSEYQRKLKVIGGEIILFPLADKDDFVLEVNKLISILDKSVDMLVMCNPNNPTGTAVNKSELEIIFEHCRNNRIWVMVDETYAEFAEPDNCSLSLTAEYDNVFTIRGTSKFFAVPGLRLGYACCSNRNLMLNLNEKKDPWSVNGLSAIGGEAMFRDEEYIQKTRALINSERQYMLSALSAIPYIHCYKSQANFILIKLINAPLNSQEIAEALIKKRLLVRDASTFDYLNEKFLRFCILSQENNRLLLEELKKLFYRI